MGIKKNKILILITVLIAAGIVALIFISMSATPPGEQKKYSSNGERIYFTSTSSSGKPITSTMDNMSSAQPMMSCVDCHGADGRGRRITMMMGSFEAPDIRYKHLTTEEHHEGNHAGEPHHYTDEQIKRAITHGISPVGEPLKFPMPRWNMSEEDLDDLLEYLKSLE